MFLTKLPLLCLAIPFVLVAMSAFAADPPAVKPIPMLDIPAAWTAGEQPNLTEELKAAKPLSIDNLGTAVYGVDAPDFAGRCIVPHPDGKSYDVLLWYRKEYMRSTVVYIVDLGTGQVRRQEFPEWEGKSRPEQGFGWWGVLGKDGKFYGSHPDWSQWDKGGAMIISQYDGATKLISTYKTIKGYGGESSPLVVAPDGWIYGSGTWCGQGNTHMMGAAYGFNPATGEVRDFGPVGEVSKITGYAPTIGACDTHLYVACGKTPWSLAAIDLKTGKQEVILRTPEGGDLMAISSSQDRYFGGAVAWIQPGIGQPKEHYWLYHGKAIPKKVEKGADGWAMDDTCPWSREMQAKGPKVRPVPEPEMDMDQLYPDANGHAVLAWRAKGATEWKKAALEGVKVFPLTLHRFVTLEDGRFFGIAAGYKGRYLFDPATRKVTSFGAGGASIYGLTTLGGKIYWSGYPSAPIYEFDPAKPWAGNNPHRVRENGVSIFDLTRVKKMLSATTAADGRVYFGGKGQRDYEGGGLSWHDPNTGKVGGMWKPFDNKPIGWVTTAHDASEKDIRTPGRYVVIGTEGGEVFTYDTKTHELLADKTFTPVAKAQYSGPLLEVAPGRMLGVTWAPGGRTSGVLYGVSVPDGKVFFNKPIPAGVPFDWGQGIGKSSFSTGTDGFLWATLSDGSKEGGVIIRIDPRDAKVQVIGRVDPLGQLVFSGNDAYLAGTTEMRCIRNIVP